MLGVIWEDESFSWQSGSLAQEIAKLAPFIICPGPLWADAVRKNWASIHCGNRCEVTTISQFIQDTLYKIEPNLKLKSKAEWLIIFGQIWNKYFSQEDNLQTFYQSYEILTDLRSYTTHLDLISPVLKFYHPQIEKAVTLFWHVLDQLSPQMVDEHGAYHLISKRWSELQNDHHKQPLIFAEFTHVSGTQIDMFHSLAEDRDVYISVPLPHLNGVDQTSWPRWLNIHETNLSSSSAPISENERLKIKATLINSEELTSFCIDQFMEKKITTVIIPSYKTELEDLHKILIAPTSFKVNVDIFKSQWEKVEKEIKNFFFANSNLLWSDLDQFCQKSIELELLKEKRSYRKIKVWQLWIEAIKMWEEVSSEKTKPLSTSVNLLSFVVQLNLPRTSTVNLEDENVEKKIDFKYIDLSHLPPTLRERSLLCLTKHWPIAMTRSNSIYPQEIYTVLATIGPIKSHTLEQEFKKQKIKKILSSGKCQLVIDKDFQEQDSTFFELEKKFELELTHFKTNTLDSEHDFLRKKIELKDDYINKKSATRLQKYIDCPRSYYFQYIAEDNIQPVLQKSITPRELGEIEHYFIKFFTESKDSLDEAQMRKQIGMFLNSKWNFPKDQVDRSIEEVYHYTKNICSLLKSLAKLPDFKTMNFEKNVGEAKIDCLIETKSGYIIFDFKRSYSPTLKELETWESIQLSYYMNELRKLGQWPVICFGHFVLSDIEKSQIFIGDIAEDKLIELDSCFLNYKIKLKRSKGTMANLSLFLDGFTTHINQVIDSLSNERDFFARPRNDEVCKFCDISTVCQWRRK